MFLKEEQKSEIYLAGGCFWGLEDYFKKLPGIYDTDVGYANGNSKNPTYEDVCRGNTGHAETVRVKYNKDRISLKQILEGFFWVIDPTSINRQGNDRGSQYRSGIYYTSDIDFEVINKVALAESKNYTKPMVTEICPLKNFYIAEEYHQDYLDKHPNGYCHINPSSAYDFIKEKGLDKPNLDFIIKNKEYFPPSDTVLKEKLSDIQYRVTRQNATELPHSSEYTKNFDMGIYVDIVTGEPLFTSMEKFEAGCGWPSFSKPLVPQSVTEHLDTKLIAPRIEVRSRFGDSHLGHVFSDGPKESGGLRYCINGSSLKFIPLKKLEEEGYGYLVHLFNNKA